MVNDNTKDHNKDEDKNEDENKDENKNEAHTGQIRFLIVFIDLEFTF
jgi:hypothetical protein